MIGVSFDYGQTLCELDTDFLAQRLEERGVLVDLARALAASPAAWGAYNTAKRRGLTGEHAWVTLMRCWLEESGLEGKPSAELADWLWSEQPRKNLWRRPIPGMFELVEELERAGVPIGITSNSEGHLKELLEELGRARHFRIIVDSGRLAFEKPDRRMFEHAATGLGVKPDSLVHVGDSWEADVLGALGVGAHAIWFPEGESRALPAGVKACGNPAEVRAALAAFGVRF